MGKGGGRSLAYVDDEEDGVGLGFVNRLFLLNNIIVSFRFDTILRLDFSESDVNMDPSI